MRFVFYEIGGEKIEPKQVISYEMTSEVGAACDGLRLTFESAQPLGEIVCVKAYDEKRLVFNGAPDVQKLTADARGFVNFIYARSSAALLVDNEAKPFQYFKPSAEQLCLNNAADLGFTCELGRIYSESSYFVPKGKSRFGAINDFVFAVFGANIYVTPNNAIRAFELSDRVKRLDAYTLGSVSCIINRSEPISEIDYKISAADNYVFHYKNEFAAKRGIRRGRLLNLSALPAWQREAAAQKLLSESCLDYYCVEACILGECDLELFDRVLVDIDGFAEKGEYVVYELVKSKGGDGEKTTALLKKSQRGELVNYVD